MVTILNKDAQQAHVAEKAVKLLGDPDAQTGEFLLIIATKRDGVGDIVADSDGDIYADGAIGAEPSTDRV